MLAISGVFSVTFSVLFALIICIIYLQVVLHNVIHLWCVICDLQCVICSDNMQYIFTGGTSQCYPSLVCYL